MPNEQILVEHVVARVLHVNAEIADATTGLIFADGVVHTVGPAFGLNALDNAAANLSFHGRAVLLGHDAD